VRANLCGAAAEWLSVLQILQRRKDDVVRISASATFMLIMLTAGTPGDSLAPSQVSKGVGLSLFVSRNLAGQPELRAVVSNNTTRKVAVWNSCNYQNGMFAIFTSQEVMELLHQNPTKRPQSCPETLFALPPDGFLEAGFTILDTLYTSDGVPVPMSPGIYHAAVTFEWREDVVARRHVLRHSTSFDWPLPKDSKAVGGLEREQAGATSPSKLLPSNSVGRTGAIVGTVLDSLTSKPLGFAVVSIVPSDLSLPIKTDNILLWNGAKRINTRGNGEFVFDNLPLGSYDVRASFICYTRDTVRVMVTQWDTTRVKLQPERSVGNANCRW